MRQVMVFILLNSCNLICNIAVSIIAPFYPTFADSEGISEDLVGFIFSAHPMGQLAASLVLGKVITNKNRSSLMNIGILCQGVGLFGFGSLKYLSGHENTIIAFSFIARLFDGFGAAMFMTPFYAYIPLLFPDHVEQKIAFAELSASLGYLIGPVFGSLLYSIGGFTLPFFVFGSVSLILATILPFQKSSLSVQEQTQVIQQYYLITLLQLPQFQQQWQILLIHSLIQRWLVQPENVGYYMSITGVTFGVGSYVVSKVGNKKKPFFIYFGMLICAYLQFFMGPDYAFTNTQPKLWISVSAWGLLGLFDTFPYILALPQLNHILKIMYPTLRMQCANYSSALFNASLAAGELIGPIAGGYLTKQYTYQSAASILGITLLATCGFYAPYLFLQSSKVKRREITIQNC